ncbi:MAG: hypothetical protein V2J51_09395 [Erythrobacter sp.]|nr:hypothetical protein [Erythrobacter sp.]
MDRASRLQLSGSVGSEKPLDLGAKSGVALGLGMNKCCALGFGNAIRSFQYAQRLTLEFSVFAHG